MSNDYSIQPTGDHAVTVYFGNKIDEAVNKKVMHLAALLAQRPFEGVLDIIPAYASLTVVYDAFQLMKTGMVPSSAFVIGLLDNLLKQRDEEFVYSSQSIRIPVCYHVSFGIDLEEMSLQRNIDVEEIITLHASVTYRVYMTGFLPGFAYMGTVDKRIETPRKAIPRQLVPAGSVGIAGSQTGIYPCDSPGGWNIVGQTPIKMFDRNNPQPCLLQPGDEVVFEPVSLHEFEKIKKMQ